MREGQCAMYQLICIVTTITYLALVVALLLLPLPALAVPLQLAVSLVDDTRSSSAAQPILHSQQPQCAHQTLTSRR
jgi:hypothetical protein